MRPGTALAALLVLTLAWAATGEPTEEEVLLMPADPAGFGPRNVFAAITSIFGAWGYWYRDTEVRIETAPSEAQIDLFYVRGNFQKLFRTTSSPARVRLPSRISATQRDAMIVRVSANGYRTQRETYRVGKIPARLVLKLEPLPNALVAIAHMHVGGRTTLTLRTTEQPEFRVIKSGAFEGFTLILSETGNGLEDSSRVSGGLVKSADVNQVGEDLIVRVETTDADVEVRSKANFDPIRREHVFSLDLTRRGARVPGAAEIQRQIARGRFSRGDPCNGPFENTLREGLTPEALARSAPRAGTVADLYRREAMTALGRMDHGRVSTRSGSQLRTGSPLELEVALQGSSDVRGYLAILGAYARTESESETVMRSLVAPDLSPDAFGPSYAKAEKAFATCKRAGR
jgi:hypothetical protein